MLDVLVDYAISVNIPAKLAYGIVGSQFPNNGGVVHCNGFAVELARH